MVTSRLLVAPRSSTAVKGPFSRRKWMHSQFLTMIASGLIEKYEKFAKLEAFLWRPSVRAVELLRSANLPLVTIRTCFVLSKKHKTI